jgi:hypothetical protein
MRTAAICVLCLVLFATTSAAHDSWQGTRQDELFSAALSQVGMTPEELRFDTDDRAFYGGDKYRLPFFDALMDEPMKISAYTRTLTDNLLADSDSPGTVLIHTQQRLSQGVRLGLVGDPLAEYRERVAELGETALAEALAGLSRKAKPDQYLGDDYNAIPPEVRDAAALVLFAMHDVLEYYRRSLSDPMVRLGLNPEHVCADVMAGAVEVDDETTTPMDSIDYALLVESLLDNVDFPLLNTGATLLTIAVSAAEGELSAVRDDFRLDEFSYRAETALGLVLLNGRGHDRYEAEPHYLLIIDTGGDERYGRGAASAGASQPIGIIIDLGGDDVYASAGENQPAFGAGVFGYGVLIDSGGEDEYSSGNLGEGAGLFGVGILCDLAGDDRYQGLALVQGSGTHGSGVLVDLAGADRYDCYQLAQGYGFTLGSGLLLDVEGNDSYNANDEDIRYPSAQSAEHNASLSQGFGFGRRGDYLDGHSWAGGVGMLVDGAGDDSYSCGVFGQGCGYWYGTGILVDKGGADQYLGQWYCQGSGAHFALGILQDDGGDDDYEGVMNMCTGAGHDFSLGWLEDAQGNDKYRCPNLSLGGANANGMGVFWDAAGDDSYLSSGVTLGMASSVSPGSLRDHILTLGVFVDGGGRDSYMEDQGDEPATSWSFTGDGLAWARAGGSDPPLSAEKGCAVDAD